MDQPRRRLWPTTNGDVLGRIEARVLPQRSERDAPAVALETTTCDFQLSKHLLQLLFRQRRTRVRVL